MMLQPTSGRQGFGYVDNLTNEQNERNHPMTKVNISDTFNEEQRSTFVDPLLLLFTNLIDIFYRAQSSFAMLRMLHQSSGRSNFNVVKPDSKNDPTPSPQQTSNDQASLIEQQTREAIKIAAENKDANNKDNNKNSK